MFFRRWSFRCTTKNGKNQTKQNTKERFDRGTKRVSYFHSAKLKLACTAFKVTSTSLKKCFEEHWLQFFCYLNSQGNFICLLRKLRIEFTSLIAKSLALGYQTWLLFAPSIVCCLIASVQCMSPGIVMSCV